MTILASVKNFTDIKVNQILYKYEFMLRPFGSQGFLQPIIYKLYALSDERYEKIKQK